MMETVAGQQNLPSSRIHPANRDLLQGVRSQDREGSHFPEQSQMKKQMGIYQGIIQMNKFKMLIGVFRLPVIFLT